MSEIIETPMNMELLTGKQLIVRVSGAIEQSNLAEFEADALAVIKSINLTLETDDDFATAKQNIKDCKTIADRIHNARQDALNSTKAISDMVATTERLELAFDRVRLDLTGKVTSEEKRRKGEITGAATKAIEALVAISPVKFAFSINYTDINGAIKNKRSLKSMEEAVAAVLETEKARLLTLEETYKTNLAAIEQSEVEFLGLYADKKNLALSPVEVVAAQISSREATAKLKAETDARKKREDDDAKAAKEKADKEEADRKAERDKAVADALAAAKITVIESPIPEMPVDLPLKPEVKSVTPGWSAPKFDHKPPMPPPSFPNPFTDIPAKTNMKKKNICEGFGIQRGEDGHWLIFESNGKHAMICVENKTIGIARDAVLSWIDDQLKD
jgi:hypothetical protein